MSKRPNSMLPSPAPIKTREMVLTIAKPLAFQYGGALYWKCRRVAGLMMGIWRKVLFVFNHGRRISPLTALALAVLIQAAGCGGKPQAPGAQSSITPPAKSSETTAWSPDEQLRVKNEKADAESILLTLAWPSEAGPPKAQPRLALCLPHGRQITASWREVRVNGRVYPVQAIKDSSRNAGERIAMSSLVRTVPFSGVIRRWPVYQLTVDTQLFEPLFKAENAEAGGELEIDVLLNWTGAAEAPAPGSEDLLWRAMMEKLIANPAGLDRYVMAPPLRGELEDFRDVLGGGSPERPWVRFMIEEEGPVRLTPEALIKAGAPPAGASADAIRVFERGEPVALLRAPGPVAPKGLKPGVYFWAHGGDGPYSSERAYWATFDASLPDPQLVTLKPKTEPGRLKTADWIERTLRLENDNEFYRQLGSFMAIEKMLWVEAALQPDAPLSIEIAPPALIEGQDVKATLDFFVDKYYNYQSALIDLKAGGRKLATLKFASPDDATRTVTIPASDFTDGKTVLTLTARDANDTGVEGGETPGEFGVWFDAATIQWRGAARLAEDRLSLPAAERNDAEKGQRFSRLWTPLPDWSAQPEEPRLALLVNDARDRALGLVAPTRAGDPARPGMVLPAKGAIEIRGAGAIPDAPAGAAADLARMRRTVLEPTEGADLLIVYHRDFVTPAKKLAAYRSSQGLRVAMADIQDVFDAFSWGEPSPLAIRNLLGHALARWEVGAPAAVLLFGDCDSDYLNVARNDVTNFVPSYTYSRQGENWASDYWFSAVAGPDDLGDFIIARISTATREDAGTVVDKIIAYDKRPAPGPWRARLGFVADDGGFTDAIETVMSDYTPQAYMSREISLNDMPYEDNFYLPADIVEKKGLKVSPEATRRILSMFRDGSVMITYYGHGSPNIWADERVWFGGDSPNSDNLFLKNSGRPAMVVNLTCNTGAVDYPLAPWNVCISEDMMRTANGGAIACLVPSGPGVTQNHIKFDEQFERALFQDGLRGVGEAVTMARLHYALAGLPADMLYMFILQGDPFTQLAMASNIAGFTPFRSAVAPGDTLPIELGDVEPAAGEAVAALCDGEGRELWSAELGAYKGGKIAFQIPVPAEAEPGEGQLRLYAWRATDGLDTLYHTPVTIERPALELDSAEIAADGDNDPICRITVANPGALKANGQLTVTLAGQPGAEPLLDRTIELGPGESESIDIGPAASKLGPSMLAVELARPAPPTAPDQPQNARILRPAAYPSGEWSGWLMPACALEFNAWETAAKLKLAAGSTRTQSRFQAQLVSTKGDVVMQRQFETGETPLPQGDIEFALSASTLNSMKHGRVLLLEGDAATGAEPLDTMDFDAIERLAPSLKLVTEASRIRPESPTDGETVFVDVTVENAGTLVSSTASLGLFSGPAAENSQALNCSVSHTPPPIEPLAPGRRAVRTLRFDPFHNPGANTIWAVLSGSSGDAGSQQLRFDLNVRTKARPAIKRTWADLDKAHLADQIMPLKAEIVNHGETDAVNVMLGFYRSDLQTEANLLGETVIERIPAGGSATGELLWHFDPAHDFPMGIKPVKPTAQLWLKGSLQRISSLEETRGEE